MKSDNYRWLMYSSIESFLSTDSNDGLIVANNVLHFEHMFSKVKVEVQFEKKDVHNVVLKG